MNGFDDSEWFDLEHFCVEGAHQSTASSHGLVGVERGARLNLENLFDDRLEPRNSGRPAENLDTVKTSTFESRSLKESNETVSDFCEKVGAELFEDVSTYFGVEIEIVGKTFDDDRQDVSVGRHLAFHFFCD